MRLRRGSLQQRAATRFTSSDHLGTPLLQTGLSGTGGWRVEYDPYGSIYAYRTGGSDADPQPLRLPGQEAEGNDQENSVPAYNIFRWYRAGWGRYTQSDPLEQRAEGVINGYRYALSNPEGYVDPTGLESTHSADRLNCIRNPIDCARVFKCKDEAAKRSREKFGYEKDSTPQNAYKHCFWNCCMTKIIGPAEAKKFGEAHEDYPDNPRCSKDMDVWNNEMGRMVLGGESCDSHCSKAPLQPSLNRPPCVQCKQTNPLNP